MGIIDISLALLGIPQALLQLAVNEGRGLRTKRRYPGTKFLRGVASDTLCSFEDGVVVYENVRLSRTKVGSYSYIGGDSILANCEIGRFCSIGPEVRIGLGMHPTRDIISCYPGFYSKRESAPINFYVNNKFPEYLPVVIGNDVWIGSRATVIDGVTIGDGAIIGAGAVVTKNVDPYTVVAGIPAKRVRERFTPEETTRLVNFAWWNRGIDFCRQHAAEFTSPTQFFSMMDSLAGEAQESAEFKN